MDDETLMRAVRDGDPARLALLFDRHNRPLFRYFWHLTNRRETSEDLVQEVFLRVLKYRGTFQDGMLFRPWAYQVARNVHLDFAGKRGKEAAMPEDSDGRTLEFPSPDSHPEDQFGRKQEALLLRRALSALPPEKREVLVMSRFVGMKYEEIAAALNCEAGTVKVRAYRALRELGDRFFALRGEKAS